MISLFGLIDSNGLIGLNGLIACMLLKPAMIFYWPHASNGDTWFVFLLSRFGSKCFSHTHSEVESARLFFLITPLPQKVEFLSFALLS